MKTINILGDTQREQWHNVVNMLRQLGGDMTFDGRSKLCDELDRYIDAMEDANEQEESGPVNYSDLLEMGYKYRGLKNGQPVFKKLVYALVCTEYVNSVPGSSVRLFDSMKSAKEWLQIEYEGTLVSWQFDTGLVEEFHYCQLDETRAHIEDYYDTYDLRIDEIEVSA